MVLNEPHVVEAHLVGQADLLDGFLDDGVVVQFGTLHFIGQAEFHGEVLPLCSVDEGCFRDCTAEGKLRQ